VTSSHCAATDRYVRDRLLTLIGVELSAAPEQARPASLAGKFQRTAIGDLSGIPGGIPVLPVVSLADALAGARAAAGVLGFDPVAQPVDMNL
jgi:hypothetical protein